MMKLQEIPTLTALKKKRPDLLLIEQAFLAEFIFMCEKYGFCLYANAFVDDDGTLENTYFSIEKINPLLIEEIEEAERGFTLSNVS